LAERAVVMRRTAAILRERIEQVAPVITLEQGKPLPDARNEVLRAASFLDWDAEQLQRSYWRIVPSDPPVQKFVFGRAHWPGRRLHTVECADQLTIVQTQRGNRRGLLGHH
jgi:acyl-CoA reductase-like NAD-dependent aldehyde dehydrogenase